MRVSEFWILMRDEFGEAYGRSLAHDQVLLALGDRTPEQALDAGLDPKQIWLAVCESMDVPPARRLGRDRTKKG